MAIVLINQTTCFNGSKDYIVNNEFLLYVLRDSKGNMGVKDAYNNWVIEDQYSNIEIINENRIIANGDSGKGIDILYDNKGQLIKAFSKGEELKALDNTYPYISLDAYDSDLGLESQILDMDGEGIVNHILNARQIEFIEEIEMFLITTYAGEYKKSEEGFITCLYDLEGNIRSNIINSDFVFAFNGTYFTVRDSSEAYYIAYAFNGQDWDEVVRISVDKQILLASDCNRLVYLNKNEQLVILDDNIEQIQVIENEKIIDKEQGFCYVKGFVEVEMNDNSKHLYNLAGEVVASNYLEIEPIYEDGCVITYASNNIQVINQQGEVIFQGYEKASCQFDPSTSMIVSNDEQQIILQEQKQKTIIISKMIPFDAEKGYLQHEYLMEDGSYVFYDGEKYIEFNDLGEILSTDKEKIYYYDENGLRKSVDDQAIYYIDDEGNKIIY